MIISIRIEGNYPVFQQTLKMLVLVGEPIYNSPYSPAPMTGQATLSGRRVVSRGWAPCKSARNGVPAGTQVRLRYTRDKTKNKTIHVIHCHTVSNCIQLLTFAPLRVHRVLLKKHDYSSQWSWRCRGWSTMLPPFDDDVYLKCTYVWPYGFVGK